MNKNLTDEVDPIITLPICFRKKFLKFLGKMKRERNIEFRDMSSQNSCFIIQKYTKADLESILKYQEKLLGIGIGE